MTRNYTHAQCFVLSNPIITVNHMLVKAKGMGFIIPPHTEVPFESGGQVSLLCQHLEGVDGGQLGITDHNRLSDSLYSVQEMSAFLRIRATSSNAGGDLISPRERGSNNSGQSLTSDRVLLGSVSGPRELGH